MNLLGRDDLIQRLLDLDEEASLKFEGCERLHLVIVGGGALVLMEFISRSTHDLDALNASRQLKNIMGAYDINSNVKTYINNFPFNYEDRLRPLNIKGKIIDFYTASLEDIVIAKLYSFRGLDHQDITDPAVLENLDWELLHHLAVDEAQMSALNEFRYQEFLNRFLAYEKEYRPCGN